jgi:hypothetical protein
MSLLANSVLQSKSQDELRQLLAERGIDAPQDYDHAQLLKELQVTAPSSFSRNRIGQA